MMVDRAAYCAGKPLEQDGNMCIRRRNLVASSGGRGTSR